MSSRTGADVLKVFAPGAPPGKIRISKSSVCDGSVGESGTMRMLRVMLGSGEWGANGVIGYVLCICFILEIHPSGVDGEASTG